MEMWMMGGIFFIVSILITVPIVSWWVDKYGADTEGTGI